MKSFCIVYMIAVSGFLTGASTWSRRTGPPIRPGSRSPGLAPPSSKVTSFILSLFSCEKSVPLICSIPHYLTEKGIMVKRGKTKQGKGGKRGKKGGMMSTM